MKPGMTLADPAVLLGTSLERTPTVKLTVKRPWLNFAYRLPKAAADFDEDDGPLAQRYVTLLGGGKLLRVAYSPKDGWIKRSIITTGADAQWEDWTDWYAGAPSQLPAIGTASGLTRVFILTELGKIIFYESGSLVSWVDHDDMDAPPVLSGPTLASYDPYTVFLAGYPAGTNRIEVWRNYEAGGVWLGWQLYQSFRCDTPATNWKSLFFAANGLLLIQPYQYGDIYRMWDEGYLLTGLGTLYPDTVRVIGMDMSSEVQQIYVSSLEYVNSRWVCCYHQQSTNGILYDGVSYSTDGEHWSFGRNVFLGATEMYPGYTEIGLYAFYSGKAYTRRATLPVAVDISNRVQNISLDAPEGGLSQLTVVLGDGDGALSDEAMVGGAQVDLELGYIGEDEEGDPVTYLTQSFRGYTDKATKDYVQKTAKIMARDAGGLMGSKNSRSWLIYPQHRFYDTFDDGAGYAVYRGDMEIVSGQMRALENGYNVAFCNSMKIQSGGIHIRFKIASEEHGAGAVFLAQDEDNFFSAGYGVDDCLHIIQRVADVHTDLWTSAALTWDPALEYDLLVRFSAGRIVMYGKPVTDTDWLLLGDQQLNDLTATVWREGYVGTMIYLGFAATTLAADMAYGAISCTVVDDSLLAAQGYIKVGDEFMYYGGKAANVLSPILRGLALTVDGFHVVGESVSQVRNFATTLLTADVNDSVTTLPVVSITGFTADPLCCELEEIPYTGSDPTNFYNCVRGEEDKSAHTSGKPVTQYLPESPTVDFIHYWDLQPERTIEDGLRELAAVSGITGFRFQDTFYDDFQGAGIDTALWDTAAATGTWTLGTPMLPLYGSIQMLKCAVEGILPTFLSKFNMVLKASLVFENGSYADFRFRVSDDGSKSIVVRVEPGTGISIYENGTLLDSVPFDISLLLIYYMTISVQQDTVSVWMGLNPYGQQHACTYQKDSFGTMVPLYYFQVGADGVTWFQSLEIDELSMRFDALPLDSQETPLDAMRRLIGDRRIRVYFDHLGNLVAGYFSTHEAIGTAHDQVIEMTEEHDDTQNVTHCRVWGAETAAEYWDEALIRECGMRFDLLDNADCYTWQDAWQEAYVALGLGHSRYNRRSFVIPYWPHLEREDSIHIEVGETHDDFIVESFSLVGDVAQLDFKINVREA